MGDADNENGVEANENASASALENVDLMVRESASENAGRAF